MNFSLTRFAHDKLGHAVGGDFAALLGALLALSPYLAGLMAPQWWAAAACAAAAVLREVYNRVTGGLFDLRDIGATMAGGVPVVVALAVHG